MKVTALIADDLVQQVRELTGGKNITDSLTQALREWVSIKQIHTLNQSVKDDPIEFLDDYTADQIRNLNRK